ncbi:MAG TPA: class I SAM-dependent methyltransferase [Gemmatimonadaceae bacterium]|nr:class I SAM-dependent methyltransferase [Gemmatimonadaceae bacterium]
MPDAGFADHFSAHAAQYARFRPDYPPALFAWLRGIVRQHRLAWDCATGNGQAAVALAGHFDSVVATDGSAAQLAAATPHPGVGYVCATAEQSGLRSASADIVTIAQALHWLDLERFHREVNRVVVRGGAIAVWSYGPVRVEPRVDEVVSTLYRETVGSYWPSERAHVDNGYRDLAFPFEAIPAPSFDMSRRWTLGQLLGYIGTWSAVQRYRRANGDAMLGDFEAQLEARWGDPSAARPVSWPLLVRAGRVGG